MDECNVGTLVNLDGRWEDELESNLRRYDSAYPGRFLTFCQLNWKMLRDARGPMLLADSLLRSVSAGARGLKIWKDIGLTVRALGRQILPNDPLLYDIWELAGELRIPVLIHVGDPLAFFLPADRHNERLRELRMSPRYSQSSKGTSYFYYLLEALSDVLQSHPRTPIICAHALYAEDLAFVSSMLNTYPNCYIDLGWVHFQLGRQPRAARDMIVRHPDQILFGTDVYPISKQVLRLYFRLLETYDEAFMPDESYRGKGPAWPMYGLGLPTAVLRKVYRQNAERLLRMHVDGDF